MEKKDTQILITLEGSLKAAITEYCQKTDRTISSYIRGLVRDDLKEQAGFNVADKEILDELNGDKDAKQTNSLPEMQ